MKLLLICFILFQSILAANLSKDKVKTDVQHFSVNDIQHIMLNDTIVPQKQEQIFIGVEEPPKFPGGLEAMKSYIEKRVKYTKEAKKQRIEGRVVIQAVIEEDGSIGICKVLRGLGSGLDEIALEIVQNMPAWEAGFQSGKAVRVMYTINVPFRF